MKVFPHQLLLVLALMAGSCHAIQKPTSYTDNNFRIVLDSKSPRGPSIGFRSNTSMDFDARAMLTKVQAETKEMIDRIWDETTKVVDKVQTEAKDFISNFRHYNKVEVGLYTALALSLTVALKSE